MKLSQEPGHTAGVTSASQGLSGIQWVLAVSARLLAMANSGPSTASASVQVKLHVYFLKKWCDQSQRPPEISDQ